MPAQGNALGLGSQPFGKPCKGGTILICDPYCGFALPGAAIPRSGELVFAANFSLPFLAHCPKPPPRPLPQSQGD